MEINQILVELLKKQNRDFIPLKSVRDRLPVHAVKTLLLKKGRSSLKMVREKLIPHLSNNLMFFEGSRTIYLGYVKSPEMLIISRLNPETKISSKQLRNRLPLKDSDFVHGLNNLLVSGRVLCQLNEQSHIAYLMLPGVESHHHSDDKGLKDSQLFQKAFIEVARGNQFVRIHEIRSYLNWSKERFETILKKLSSDLVIQLLGGDPSLFTEKEIKDSYIDDKGRLRTIINWIK